MSESLLNRLYEALRVWEKLESGELLEVLRRDSMDAARADWCTGGISYYTGIENTAGLEVGRVHHLLCPRGVRRYPTYILLGDTRLYRVGHDELAPPA